MKPTLRTSSFSVYTNDTIYRHGFDNRTSWAWVAHGPHGSEAGVAETADAALNKARAAAVLLEDDRRSA